MGHRSQYVPEVGHILCMSYRPHIIDLDDSEEFMDEVIKASTDRESDWINWWDKSKGERVDD